MLSRLRLWTKLSSVIVSAMYLATLWLLIMLPTIRPISAVGYGGDHSTNLVGDTLDLRRNSLSAGPASDEPKLRNNGSLTSRSTY